MLDWSEVTASENHVRLVSLRKIIVIHEYSKTLVKKRFIPLVIMEQNVTLTMSR